MKPEKSKGRGRGRGRGGSGRGRGQSTEAKEKPKRQSRDGSKKRKATEGTEDVDAWYEESWNDGYGHPDEQWAHEDYGTSGYHWDGYAWAEGKHALQSIKDQDKANDGKAKKAKKNKEKEEEQVEGPQERKKAKKADKTEKTSNPSAGSKAKTKLQETSTVKEKKQKKRKDEEVAQVEEPSSIQERIEPPPKKVRKIQKYVSLYFDNPTEKVDEILKEDLKSNLAQFKFQECRLNIYWKNPACGCTSKSKGKDLAHFFFPADDRLNYMTRLAMALKCAEMFVTWAHKLKKKLFDMDHFFALRYAYRIISV